MKYIYKIAHFFLKNYWKLLKPETFGVKVIVRKNSKILLIKNTYGLTSHWQLPGGGFNPKKESAESACQRELNEELSIKPHNLKKIGEYFTDSEGKKDTVMIFSTEINDDAVEKSSEIQDAKWFDIKSLNDYDITKITRYSINLLLN